MATAPVWSVKLCYDPNLRPEATARPVWEECVILVGDTFFKASPRERKWIIAHETGHTFEEQIKNLEAALCSSAAPVFGKMVDSGKRLHYEGVFGEYRPSEAFATCVAEMYYSPAEFKKRYPEAYDFIKNTLPANWKDAVRANIAQIPNVTKEYDEHLREKHPKRKPVPQPTQKPITKLTIEQRKYLAAHKKMGVGCNRWVEFYQVDIEEAIREAKHLEVQGEQVQIEVTWKDKRPAYTVYMVVCSSPEPAAKTAAKPAPDLPPILTAPPELTADVLGGMTPTAAPKRKPAPKPKAKLREELKLKMQDEALEIKGDIGTEIRALKPMGQRSELGMAMSVLPKRGICVVTPLGELVFAKNRQPSREQLERWGKAKSKADQMFDESLELGFSVIGEGGGIGNKLWLKRGEKLLKKGLLTPDEKAHVLQMRKFWKEHPHAKSGTIVGGKIVETTSELLNALIAARRKSTPQKPPRKPAPTLPPILTAPPELTADVLGTGPMGLTPTPAAPKRKPATRTTRKQPAKLTAEEIFQLGCEVAAAISKVEGSVLKPTQTEIKNAANAIGVTQAAARVAIEYYNWGHTYPDVPSVKRTTRKPAAKPKPTAVPKARKPKKPAARTTKPKAKKTAATPKLTASQREYLAIQGFVMVKRGGKYVRVTG